MPQARADAPPARGPYAVLLHLAERRLQLAGERRIEELEALGGEWERLTATLPARPPADARSMLEHAQLLHERTHVELLRAREALLHELGGVAQATRAARGYAPRPHARPLVERSA